MKNFFIRLLGGVPVSELTVAEKKASMLETAAKHNAARVEVLEADKLALQSRIKRTLPLINIAAGDPSPSDEEKYKQHARDWNTFYKDLLSPKLEHLIALSCEELAWSGMPGPGHEMGLPEGMERRDYDWMMRGTVNAFKMLQDHGTLMVSVHSQLTQPNQ